MSKPWGRETWLSLNGRYCFKQITVLGGRRCSLPYHEVKAETLCVVSGEGLLELDGERLAVRPGDFWAARPGPVHRPAAVTDRVLHEASTPAVDDVVRLEHAA